VFRIVLLKKCSQTQNTKITWEEAPHRGLGSKAKNPSFLMKSKKEVLRRARKEGGKDGKDALIQANIPLHKTLLRATGDRR
jgi:hypothetical protein